MKKLYVIILIVLMLLCTGCHGRTHYDVVATTLPVYDFTAFLCDGTSVSVGRLISENVSCLHDYTLQTEQMRIIEGAEVVVISGAGLEDFLEDALCSKQVIDASSMVHLHSGEHSHEHSEHGNDGDHHHDLDPHFWLSPDSAKIMAENICSALSELYPQHRQTFCSNLSALTQMLDDLQSYGDTELSDLHTRQLITFHDGFSYFAESFDLTILEAVEEESGSEASAAEIIHLVQLVEAHSLPAIFTEKNGSNACAGIISAETGVQIHALDMAMSGDSYFDAMYHNIDTVKEALG